MKTIWKFKLRLTDYQQIEIPSGFKMLTANIQGGPTRAECGYFLWAEVCPENAPTMVDIYVVGTGNPMPEEATNYVASIMDKPFVWHVYYRETGINEEHLANWIRERKANEVQA
jgi:hypothetical protein